MSYDRAALNAYALSSIEKGSKSFAFASKIFDAETREKVMLFYAWCRRCDDITDGQDHGHIIGATSSLKTRKEARKRISKLREMTAMAYAGKVCGDDAFNALGLLLKEHPIEEKLIHDIIEGFALDAEEWRPRSEDDLYQYCYHVAGAVGIIMAQIMGVSHTDKQTLDRACDLGIAFQLANIARDVGDDAANDRCYLPVIWLVEMDIEPGEIMRPHYRPALAKLSKRLCIASARYNASARVGAAKLSLRSRIAINAAANIYGDIAVKVLEAKDTAWDQRQYVSKPEKFAHFVAATAQSMKAPDPISRDGLWTRS